MALKYDFKILTKPSDVITWFDSKKPIGVLWGGVAKDPFKIADNLIYLAIVYNESDG